MSRFNNWWDYLLPWNYGLQIYDNISKDGYQFGDVIRGFLTQDSTEDEEVRGAQDNAAKAEEVANSQEILGHVANNSVNELLADRAHTEMREDTAYQRSVADMRKAGLNPYTIGASPAASSASSVGSASIASKVQILGYILGLKNLDAKNRQITNSALTSVLSSVTKMVS